MWRVSDKSADICERVVSGGFYEDIFKYLGSDTLSPDNLKKLQTIKQDFVQGLLGVLHNVVQKAQTAREAYRSCNAVEILQPFRQAKDFQVNY
jgi:hypothetical protein